MATKKTVKKSTKPVALLPAFNKKNLLALADAIHLDKGGRVSFTKLCNGALRTKEGKLVVHCAIGEAYYHFVSRSFKRVYRHDNESDATDEAVVLLAKAAHRKKGVNIMDMESALSGAVGANDSDKTDDDGITCSDLSDPAVLESRAREVANHFRNEVAPLLR